MDTIDTFLDAMFAPYPSTARLTEAKGELRAMMEDAYADAIASGRTHNEAVGQVITDFGNLEELAPVLGIETELHPTAPETSGTHTAGTGGTHAAGLPVVTLAEAQALAEARRTTGTLLGWGVSTLVLAGAASLLILGLAEDEAGLLPISASTAAAISTPLTLLIVAIGVAILIHRSRAFVSLKHLTAGEFTRNPATAAWAARLRADNEGPRSRALAIAVGLWICAAVPVVTLNQLEDAWHRDLTALGTAAALVLVAIGLRIFLPTTWASSTYATLTEEGRHESGSSDNDPVVNTIASVYWPATVAIYLTWSFGTDGWSYTWIIWPVAGVLFGALYAGISAWRHRA